MSTFHTRTVVTWMRKRAEQETRMVVVSEALEGSHAAAERKLLALALSAGADAIEQLDALKAREATTAPRQDAIP